MKQHIYNLEVVWTGNLGNGTTSYQSYSRAHDIIVKGKEIIHASSDVQFRGDGAKYNPEELFISSISACHMLWYLHFCADAGIVVKSYKDNASGILSLEENGSGKFTEVQLSPKIVILDPLQINQAKELHQRAHQFCFIANSCSFPIFIDTNELVAKFD
ncbi:MAG: OsmC family protein [Bacteroidia bacterium]